MCKKDFSKVTDNVSYYDCENCVWEFGKNKQCCDCNYYNDCLTEKEISDYERKCDEALERFYDRLENEEYPL